MTLHELNMHLDMVAQLNAARASLANMQSKVLKAQQYDGMPHARNVSRGTESLAILLETQMDRVSRLERIVKRSEESGIREWIENIPDNRTMVIFNLRFLCGFNWQTVAEYVGGHNTPEAVKAVCYRYLQAKDGT